MVNSNTTSNQFVSDNDGITPLFDETAIVEAIYNIKNPVHLVKKEGRHILENGKSVLPFTAYVPACNLEHMGDPSFCKDHGIKYPYIAGAMANEISSIKILEAMGNNGMLAFFGAGGLSIEKIEKAIDWFDQNKENIPYGFNLIHNPNDPDQEAAVVDLYLRRKVKLIEAAAFLDLTLPLVRYRVHGIFQDREGNIITPNRIIAKISRVETAEKFFRPPPERFLKILINQGHISQKQAELAAEIPMAQDITAEADSGGHTDNRPALTLFPTITALRNKIQKKNQYPQKLRVGAAGGVSTPSSAAAMFSMGAAYILTGTINQSCMEAGTSDIVRKMLSNAKQGDIAMAPSADMFEIGARVQVLKHGTMFAMRAAKLYEFYRKFNSLNEIPAKDRLMIEKNIFRSSLENIWEKTRNYFMDFSPRQILLAEKNPKHKMALLFRWYLGQSSLWANSGEPSRIIDYQIWCGPSMGAFNEWVKGSFLEDYKNRSVVTIALNLLYGAAVFLRFNTLRYQAINFSPEFSNIVPYNLLELKKRLKY